jgi:hypothetical protein
VSNKSKWIQEKEALKKIQVHFTLNDTVDTALRHDAIEQDMSPSNVLRKLIGLKYTTISRPRIALNLTDLDFQSLSERYDIPIEDKEELKRQVRREVQRHYSTTNRDKQE